MSLRTAELPDVRPEGLTSARAAELLATFGPNAVEEHSVPAWKRLALRFWGPLPWMLEVTIALTLALGKDLQAAIITALLVVNAVLAFVQSSKAGRALTALRQRLSVTARARRDGTWQRIPARELVPGDLVRIRTGDIVPADLDLVEGHVSVDQSTLTGESFPEEIAPGSPVLGSSRVQRGEATGVVSATGEASFFGRTARLVQEARPPTSLERAVFSIIRYLVVIDVVLVIAMIGFALATGTSMAVVAPFALIVLIASVPVALPAIFSAAQAIGAQTLIRDNGVLVSRLQAVQEAASMDVLCTDKTGTLTTNHLELAVAEPCGGLDRERLLELAALASDPSGQDPIDLAILAAAPEASGRPGTWRRVDFFPFDPSTKRTEALVERPSQGTKRTEALVERPAQGTKRTEALVERPAHGGPAERNLIVKGMPDVVVGACADPPPDWAARVDRIASRGCRVLAVAEGGVSAPGDSEGGLRLAGHAQLGGLRLAGLIGLADPPRPDAANLVAELGDLGVTVKMVTGDTVATAGAVASAVGIRGDVISGAELRADPARGANAGVVAAVYPEDKYAVVTALQKAGHTVGMTGDGVNDAPALRQAEVGIAVTGAVDVARAAASLVLTDPGLIDVIAAVKVSRSIHQRMLTWVLNKVIKTSQVAGFLILGFFLTRHLVTTSLDIVLLLFTNDFVTVTLAVDRVRPSRRPDRWRAGTVTVAALALATGVVAESFLDLYLARRVFHLGWPQTQTLMFVMLVFTGQATVFLIRERGRMWASRPAPVLMIASGCDIALVTLMATAGILMPAVALGPVLAVLGVAMVATLLLDPVKVAVLRRLSFS